MAERAVLIGLCGRSGSGKGTAAAYFSELGMSVIDTDAVYREMTLSDTTPCMKAIVSEFGREVVASDGSLARARLADIVFSRDPSRLSVLNRITHRYIIEETERRIEQLTASGAGFIVIDAPLLFESGLSDRCCVIIAVTAEEETLVSRISRRDGITCEESMRRLASQISNDELRRCADYVIENDGDTGALRRRVGDVARDIFKRFSSSEGVDLAK